MREHEFYPPHYIETPKQSIKWFPITFHSDPKIHKELIKRSMDQFQEIICLTISWSLSRMYRSVAFSEEQLPVKDSGIMWFSQYPVFQTALGNNISLKPASCIHPSPCHLHSQSTAVKQHVTSWTCPSEIQRGSMHILRHEQWKCTSSHHPRWVCSEAPALTSPKEPEEN